MSDTASFLTGVIMAYLTGFFLVFAGMLIGYFLWYRDLSEEEQAHALMDCENNELHRELKVAQRAKLEAEERAARQRGQLSVLQQIFEDWTVQREQTERERACLAVELEDKRSRMEESSQEIQRLKKVQVDLEDRLHQMTCQHLESANAIEQGWEKKYLTLELQQQQTQTELAQTIKDKERLAQTLKQVETTNAELQAEISANRSLLETATRNVSGLKQEYTSLESSLKESHDQLKRARGDAAAALSEKKMALQSLHELEAQWKSLNEEASQLRQQMGSTSAADQELLVLRQTLETTQQQLELVTRQRDRAMEAEKTIISGVAGLQTRLNNQESTIHRLRELHRDSLEKIKHELQLRSDLEIAYEEHCRELEQRFNQQLMEKKADDSAIQTASQTEHLTKQLGKQAQELKAVISKRDLFSQELTQTKALLAKFENEHAESTKKLQVLNHEAAKLKAETLRLANQDKQIAELKAQLNRESELQRLSRKHVEELEHQLHLKDQQSKIENASILQFARQVEDLQTELQARNERIERMELEIESKSNRIQSLEQLKTDLENQRNASVGDFDGVRGPASGRSNLLSFSKAMEAQKKSTWNKDWGGYILHDPVRGTIFTQEPDRKDDLKKISGVAGVLEGKLNDQGIYTFKQIAEWSPAAIEEFGRLLRFKDRIVRDDWQGQAKKLCQNSNSSDGQVKRAA